jgi:hypothetical protein
MLVYGEPLLIWKRAMKRNVVLLLATTFIFSVAISVHANPDSDNNKSESSLEARKIKEAKELDGLREGKADSTEYTLNPSSVELLVELDPNGYGFRSRTHRMTISCDFDFILRGRAMLHYDYRFFRYFSVGILTGIDWTDISLVGRMREELSKKFPWQFSILGGVSGKWRLTEWYIRSAFFLEPSLLFGYMWQELPTQKTTHWRIRPGLFGGIETVFDSGFSLVSRVGVEFPFDFGRPNPKREVAEPLFVIAFGFAL